MQAGISSLFIVVAVVSLQGEPSMAADAAHGEQLARRWCASCHIVDAGEHRIVADQPPAFASIAQRPGFNVDRLAFFLLDPHPVMPNMGLSRSEAADLAAYIASLRK